MSNKLSIIYAWAVRSLLFFLPDAPAIMRFRGWLYGFMMKNRGGNFQVAHNVVLNSLNSISVGDDVYIANNCVFIANGEIDIADEVIFGPGNVIAAGNHVYLNGSYRFSPSTPKDVSIGKGAWVAANCTIVGGAAVPDRSIVAAGSVFLPQDDCIPDSMYCGVPAVFKVKMR